MICSHKLSNYQVVHCDIDILGRLGETNVACWHEELAPPRHTQALIPFSHCLFYKVSTGLDQKLLEDEGDKKQKVSNTAHEAQPIRHGYDQTSPWCFSCHLYPRLPDRLGTLGINMNKTPWPFESDSWTTTVYSRLIVHMFNGWNCSHNHSRDPAHNGRQTTLAVWVKAYPWTVLL